MAAQVRGAILATKGVQPDKVAVLVMVAVLSIDRERRRIALTAKKAGRAT